MPGLAANGKSEKGMQIKIATEAQEFLEIHRLNYETFVEEIPQHAHNSQGQLIDKFHHRNQYIIATKNNRLIAMVCCNAERPFSLDARLDGLDNFLPPHGRLAEIRLLAVRSGERKTGVAYRLLQYLCQHLILLGIDAAVISATTRQLKLYAAMGFTPFGPLTGAPGAQFQPMYITLNELRNDFRIR